LELETGDWKLASKGLALMKPDIYHTILVIGFLFFMGIRIY